MTPDQSRAFSDFLAANYGSWMNDQTQSQIVRAAEQICAETPPASGNKLQNYLLRKSWFPG